MMPIVLSPLLATISVPSGDRDEPRNGTSTTAKSAARYRVMCGSQNENAAVDYSGSLLSERRERDSLAHHHVIRTQVGRHSAGIQLEPGLSLLEQVFDYVVLHDREVDVDVDLAVRHVQDDEHFVVALLPKKAEHAVRLRVVDP